jgi:2-deoxy-D-gluconate 3-dehydrogenase
MTERIQDLFALDGKRALITGSSSGIGQAQAVALAEAGARVVVHGTRPDKIDDTLAQIAAVGGEAVGIAHALSDVASGSALVQKAVDALGGLDIFIHSAGANRRKPIVEVTEEDFDSIVDVHLKLAFFLCQAVHPHLKATGGGKIVTIGSMTSFRGMGLLGPYGMSKAGVALFTQTMAVEWAADNIQANCLAPGFIETPLTAQGLFADPYRRKWIMDRVPARRPGYPSDLVGTTVFLCSAASDFLTGQTIAVDGGFLTGDSFAERDV